MLQDDPWLLLLQENCLKYSAPVSTHGDQGTVYRNQHCYECQRYAREKEQSNQQGVCSIRKSIF